MKLLQWLFLLRLVLACLFVEADEAKPRRKPLLLMAGAPMCNYIAGGNGVEFVLYDDGLTIYRVGRNERFEYDSALLSAAEVRQFIADYIPTNRFDGLDSHYQLTKAFDLQNVYIEINTGPGKQGVSVYGFGWDVKEHQGKAPERFTKLYQQLLRFQRPQAKPWVPERVEVILTSRSSTEKGGLWGRRTPKHVSWPTAWPGLSSTNAIFRWHGPLGFGSPPSDCFSIFLESSLLSEVQRLERQLSKSNLALKLDSRFWTMRFRLPMPGEEDCLRNKNSSAAPP